jgi:hypothetical protein
VRRRASLRKGSVAGLFEATEREERRLKWGRFLGRGPPLRPSHALVGRLVVALVLVAIIAVTALVLSVWLLVRADEDQTLGVPKTVTARVTEPAEPAEHAPASGTRPAKRATFAPTKLRLTAARGDCWLEARVSSATGKLLFSGNLEQGKSIVLTKTRLWVAFGAGANLDVTLNGRRVESFPTGTAAVVVTAKGVSPPVGI